MNNSTEYLKKKKIANLTQNGPGNKKREHFPICFLKSTCYGYQNLIRMI